MKIKRFKIVLSLCAPKIGLFILLFKLSWGLEAFSSPSPTPKGQEELSSHSLGHLTTRCQGLLDTRSKKIDLKQKAYALKKRVDHLDQSVTPQMVTKKKKIEYISRKIDLKIQILNQEISNLEEDIVRKGCPGIKL